MQIQVIAPCPKKPSSSSTGGSSSYGYRYDFYYNDNDNNWSNNSANSLDIQDACLELQQILSSVAAVAQQQDFYYDNITRTGNPLIQDSSFTPSSSDASTLHQAVSQLSVSRTAVRRPRSYSMGDPRNHYILQPSVY